jgi:hypothetical protein
MSPRSQLVSVAPAQLDAEELLAFWNAAQPEELPASSRLLEWWVDAHGAEGTGLVMQLRSEGELRAVSLLTRGSPVQPDANGGPVRIPFGWVDGLVAPVGRYRNERRARLLAAAEMWLRQGGAGAIQLGGGPFSLCRGALPDERTAHFLLGQGYVEGSNTHLNDLALDVARYIPPADAAALPGLVRPAQPRDRDEIEALLAAPLVMGATGESASDAHRAALRLLLNEGRVSDLMVLWTDDGAMGVAQLAFSDSLWPLELTYPWTLPRPWSALPLLALREGQSDAALVALLDGSMRRLHNNGVNSCVAPGILRSAPYEQTGFAPYRAWRAFVKRLAAV